MIAPGLALKGMSIYTCHYTCVFQLVLVGHFVWRCQWRRISLSRLKSHVPGDKAFKSKVCVCVRERERERGEKEREVGREYCRCHRLATLYAHWLLQRIRQRLICDFGFIEHLCPDPRLISDSCDPSLLGGCKGKDLICSSATICH